MQYFQQFVVRSIKESNTTIKYMIAVLTLFMIVVIVIIGFIFHKTRTKDTHDDEVLIPVIEDTIEEPKKEKIQPPREKKGTPRKNTKEQKENKP